MRPFKYLFLSLFVASPALSQPVIIAVGDSLTAGYGVTKAESYPAQLEQKLRGDGFPGARVINAGTSGDTAAMGLRTLKFQLKHTPNPELVIFCLGANDGLQGLGTEQLESHLRASIEFVRKRSIKMLFVGMMVPPNYGPAYVKAYTALFPKLAKEYELPFVPFLLEGVAGEPALNLPDGKHPNKAGYQRIVQTLYPHVKKLL